LKACYQAILDVRTSAHLIDPARIDEVICLMYISLSTETEVHTNSEADTHIIGRSLVSRHTDV
jgi:hypothetical protein